MDGSENISQPESRKLSPEEIHVWDINFDNFCVCEESLVSVLSENEIYKAGRFLFERDRNRYIRSHWSLRKVLSLYVGGSPEQLKFKENTHGKPIIAAPLDTNGLRFNMTHSGSLAIIGVTRDREIGVDIEKLKTATEIDAIVDRFFSKSEAEFLYSCSAGDRLYNFFLIWTRKEAVIKAKGKTLASEISRTVVLPARENLLLESRGESGAHTRWFLKNITRFPGYVGAVCTSESPGRLLFITLLK